MTMHKFTIPGRLPCLNDYIKIERGGCFAQKMKTERKGDMANDKN